MICFKIKSRLHCYFETYIDLKISDFPSYTDIFLQNNLSLILVSIRAEMEACHLSVLNHGSVFASLVEFFSLADCNFCSLWITPVFVLSIMQKKKRSKEKEVDKSWS